MSKIFAGEEEADEFHLEAVAARGGFDRLTLLQQGEFGIESIAFVLCLQV